MRSYFNQLITPYNYFFAYRTGKGCVLAVYQLMIGQVLLGFESLAAILAGKFRRCRVGLEMTT